MTKVNNVPERAWNKEYMVIRWCDGAWWYWGATDDSVKAMTMADGCDGEIRKVENCEVGQF